MVNNFMCHCEVAAVVERFTVIPKQTREPEANERRRNPLTDCSTLESASIQGIPHIVFSAKAEKISVRNDI